VKLKHLGLFEGIGGFSLAAEWSGWETLAWCEWNPFGQKVLKHHFPKADAHGDITKTDFSIYRGRIDIITGGFPCQPYSLAGKRLGKEDERHLWPQMRRAIREVQPRWVVGENVFGLVNWNGGMVFNEVQTDLEAEGYEVFPYVLPACSVNAPHRRDRVWFVAFKDTDSNGRGGVIREEKSSVRKFRDVSSGDNERVRADNAETSRDATDTVSLGNTSSGQGTEVEGIGSERIKGKRARGIGRKRIDGLSGLEGNTPDTDSGRQPREEHRQEEPGWITEKGVPGNWENFPTQSPIRKRDDGVSDKLLNFVVNDLRDEISKTSKENRIENLQEVWERVQQEEVWGKIRGLYSLESKDILFKTMQLYSAKGRGQIDLSPFSEEFSKGILQHLRKYKEFRRSPQGRELEKQRDKEFGNTLSFLPHEVALAARRFQSEITKFENWHTNESIKAYGNAIVPQVAFQIFQAINKYEESILNEPNV